jgi:hypothetical protein
MPRLPACLTLTRRWSTWARTYGALVAEINARLLALGRQAAYGEVDVTNVWKDPLPEDSLSDAQTLEIDVRNGLSQETYLEKRGYDASRELERKEAEQQRQQEQLGNVGDMMLREFGAGRGNGQNFLNPQAQRNGGQRASSGA